MADGRYAAVVSTLNDLTGTIVANAALVGAGTGGEVSVYPSNDTNLVIDINGYFATPTSLSPGVALYAVMPCRVIDTRTIGSGQPFSGTLDPPVDVEHSPCASVGAGPSLCTERARSYLDGPLGYLTLWPDGIPRPLASTLNALDGVITNNMAIVPPGQGMYQGKIDAYASGITQLILDISAYFAPLPPLGITTTSLPGGTINVPYSSTLAASGGEPPYNWSILRRHFAAGSGTKLGWNDLWNAHRRRGL